MKIEEMADVFLNLANFVQHTLLTLEPPSSYDLNLKALIKVLKEILRYSFERKFDIDKLHFSEKDTSQKPMFFRFKKKNQNFISGFKQF